MKFWICLVWPMALFAQSVQPYAPVEVLIANQQGVPHERTRYIIQCQYRDSVIHGPVRVLWEDSTLMVEFEMDKGTFVGQYRSYYSDGSLYEEASCRSTIKDLQEFKAVIDTPQRELYISTGISYAVYSTDTAVWIDEITYETLTEVMITTHHSRSFIEGAATTYWPNGQVKLDSWYKDGDYWGHRAYYNEDGSLALLRYNDASTHLVIAAWENGQPEIENGTGQMSGALMYFMENVTYRNKEVYYYQNYRLCKAYYLYDGSKGIYRTKHYD